MSYTDQVEAYVGAYPATTAASIPMFAGIVALPAYPHVEVRIWDNEYCELLDANGIGIARFRLVG
jgi:hypothetical protein